MTSSDLTTPARSARPGDVTPGAAARAAAVPGLVAAPEIVAAVTGALPVVTTVTAVVVTRGSTPFLAHTLAALRRQTTSPRDVVVVDAATGDVGGEHDGLQLGDARFVAAPRARSFGDAVDVALAHVDPGTWLWLLHDDSAPAPDALAELLRAVEHSAAVAVAGPKQERWTVGTGTEPAPPFEPGSASRLVEVGVTTTPLGRRMTGIDEDEIDQGQHDARDDVLAVGLAGALVRRTVWQELGGTDPEYGPFGDGLDLCRRARLAGHRVIVVPSAVVRHAQASLLGLRERRRGSATVPAPDPDSSYVARRRAQLHARLVGVAAPWLPFVALAMVLGAPFHAAYRLLVKQPGHARDELVAPLWALVRVGPVARARRRARRTRRLPRRALRALRGTWREVLAERRDRRLARAERRRTAWAPTDIERRELRALAVRRRAGLAGAVVALVAYSAVVFGPLVGSLLAGGRLVGGSLLPATGTLGDVWRAATTGWVTTGLGAPAPADPYVTALVPASLLAGGATQSAVNLLVPACFVVAGAGAWFAAGAVVRSVPARAWAVVVWVAAPALLTAVGGGRVGAVLVHATLPWLALAVVRALGLQRVDVVAPPTADGVRRGARPEPGSLAAAATAGLLFAVVVAGSPVLLPVGVLVLLVVALGVRSHRRYLALVPVPAVVLFAPFLVHVARTATDGGWRLLLADPGAPAAATAADPWQQLLGLPTSPDPWFGIEGGGTLDLLARWAPFVAGAVVVGLALVAVLRGRRLAVGAWFVAALGLATAVLAGSTVVAAGASPDDPVTGWPGAGVSLALLALLGAALAGAPRLPDGGAPAWQTGAVVALGLVMTLLPLGSAASWTAGVLQRDDARVGAVRATTAPVVPPVGRQMQSSPNQARVLSLELGPGGVVEYAALRSDGPQAVDSSVVVHAWQTADPGATEGDLPRLVAELVSGTSADVTDGLGRLGVGAVLLPAAGETDQARAELVARLDMVPGLERMTEGQAGLVWRVAPEGGEPSWARVVSGPGSEPLAADREALRPVDTTVGDGPRDRVVVLAEAASSGWRATLDGRPLQAVDPGTTGGLQAFDLGPDAGHLEVFHAADHRSGWMTVAGVTLLVYVLLAVPVRRRRAGVR
ncbi:glycosyltransferase family 2 protein [Cellulosimicrobium protaetiae]|uniref:Glycosyltransferase family 2 protein n=1 Tax=Cellulosimicrobium protaetiae TaxID=2587808 RepID=A0A6M5UDM8_9MICO|nr:glycosyltransferase [Cellulosimicrobium protaetiae]QJW36114.1 glycosyltransferase family 2 protein [Cellulosimicrobium protaetiae]